MQLFEYGLVHGVKPIATGDIAPSDNWWPDPACGHYGLDQLDLAIADSKSQMVMSVWHAPAVLVLFRRAHHPSLQVTVL